MFKLRLALQLGRTLKELNNTMGSKELPYWKALYRNDPWGGFRIDQAAATIASTMVNMKLGQNVPSIPDSDFLAFNQSLTPPPDTSQEDINASLMLLFGARRS